MKLDVVEAWVEQAARSYNRAKVRLDPWQAIGLAQRLRARGIEVEEFAFTAASVGRLGSSLHQALRNRALALPEDADLFDELANVRLRETSPGVLRLDHDEGQHDDRAIALALCVQELLEGSDVVPTVGAVEIPRDLDRPSWFEDDVTFSEAPYSGHGGDAWWE